MSSPAASVARSPSAEAGPLPVTPTSAGSPVVAADSGTVAAATELEPVPSVSAGSKCTRLPEGDDFVQAD
ncbi:hypothetical protein V8E53_001416, partial [Lactarius tabidus]